jgi:HD-GYP domain-containing protein (c-di-GMP phosphodiesterase class II)
MFTLDGAASGTHHEGPHPEAAACGTTGGGGEAVPTTARARAGTRLVDELVCRLKVSDAPERFQRLAVRMTREQLGVAALAWVPASSRESVVLDGGVVGLAPEGYRRLTSASDIDTGSTIGRLRRVRQSVPTGELLAAVATADEGRPVGWLVAIGPPAGRDFDPDELEALHSVAALLAAQRSNARVYGDLKDLLFGVIRALTSAIDAKDPYTSGHSERVARIAARLGEQLGLTPNQRGDLYLMGLLHDVGKIGVDDVVLKKPSKLTPDEYRQIQAHVRIGVHILADLTKLQHLLPGVAHHHESMDGSGYPAGLRGEQIPLPARIMAVADAFDAMSSNRPYRRRLEPEQIDRIFHDDQGRQWDSTVVEALFACRQDIERIRSKGLGDSLRQVVGETLGRGTCEQLVG